MLVMVKLLSVLPRRRVECLRPLCSVWHDMPVLICEYCRCYQQYCVGTIFWSCRWLMAAGKRPVPFRTRLAKPARADGTAPGRVWESRLPPAYNFIFLCVVSVCCCGTYSPHFFVLVGVCTTCVGVWCGSGVGVCAPDSCFALSASVVVFYQ